MRLLSTRALPEALCLLPDHSCSSTTPATSGLGCESSSCCNYLSVIAQRSGLLMPGQRLKGAAGMVARSIPSPCQGPRGPGVFPQSGFMLSVLCGRQTQGEDLSRLLTDLLKSLDKSKLNLHLNCFSLCLSSLLPPSRT